jgi:hypothetical protein
MSANTPQSQEIRTPEGRGGREHVEGLEGPFGYAYYLKVLAEVASP